MLLYNPFVVDTLSREGMNYSTVPLPGNQGDRLRYPQPRMHVNVLWRCSEHYRIWDLLFAEQGQAIIRLAEIDGASAPHPGDEVFAPLRDGQVITDFDNPAALACWLVRECPGKKKFLPAKTRIAAILSLWNWQASRLPDKIRGLRVDDLEPANGKNR